ncbi:MAG: MMPL family transporter [Planctomycetaceae bacterium]|nr:MMPL family transporter [Planctomycetaceae bacterium]MBT7254495.1 MMPL family transporter [Planctomycetaceae bacterium]MBT7916504.1 MMPL family transporter [Planctomycetaceae bacterium]
MSAIFYSALKSLYQRQRWFLMVFVVVLTVIAARGYQDFGFDNEARGLFRTSDSAFDKLEEIFEQFRPDENDCLVVIEAGEGGFFNARSMKQLRQLQQQLVQIPLITNVLSPLSPEMIVCKELPQALIPAVALEAVDWQQVQRDAHQHPLVAGNLLALDGKHMLLILRMGKQDLLVSDYETSVGSMLDVIDRWNTTASHVADLTGIPPVRVEVFHSIKTDTRHLMLIGSIIGGLVSICVFRNWALALMTFVGALTGGFWSLGLLGVKLNLISTILPVLIVVIGLTDAVHIVFDIRDSRMRGIKPVRASWLAVRRLGIACAGTSITTAIGFGSLAFSQIDVIRQFGITCAVGTLITFVAVILVVPLLAGTVWVGGAYRGNPPRERDMMRRWGVQYADWILQHRRWILLGSLLFISLLVATATRLYPDSHIYESLPTNSRSTVALQKIDAQFGGILSAIILVEWQSENESDEERAVVMSAVKQVVTEVHREPDLHNPMSIVNFREMFSSCTLLTLPKTIEAQWFREDIGRAIVVARMRDKGIHFHQQMLVGFREQLSKVQQQHAGIEITVSGSAVVATRNLSKMITDLVKSLAIAATVIFVVLTFMFRSLRLGLVSLVPNLLPLLFTAAFLVWTGQALRLTSVLLFTVSLGIAVDDTIHFIVRYLRERKAGFSVDDAIRNSIVSVGGALLVSTFILLAGFSASATSVMPHSQLFSQLACVAIVMAFLGDMVLLPAILRFVDGK